MAFEEIDSNNEMVKKIIKASYEVFALNDYKKASTNMIVKKAGISRGILYHYFKDKEALFNYLNFYSFEKSVEEVDNYLDWNGHDIIKRVCDITKFRLETIEQYPYLIDFGEKYKDQLFKVSDVSALRQWKEKFYKLNINYGLFKKDIDLEKALHIIKWTFRGIYKELLVKQEGHIIEGDIGKLKDACNGYYELLAASFYE